MPSPANRCGPCAAAAHGFTLIELMIAVAVLAIIVGIAYPSYLEQIRKTRRSDAKIALLNLAQTMERNYTEANRYDQDSAGNTFTLPYTEAPKDEATKYYDLTLQSVSSSAFTLQATPKGAQAGDTKCTSFTLTHTGAKNATGSDAANCWR